MGEKQKALEYYNQALSILRALGNRPREATALNNIGSVYDDIDEKQKALGYYNQALSIFKAVNERSGEANTLNNIGLVYADLGEKQKALEYYTQALTLRQNLGDKKGEAITLTSLAGVYIDIGEMQKALDHLNQSLPLRRAVGDTRGEATTLTGIALVYSELGEIEKALDYYNQTLSLRRTLGDKAGLATTLNNIAQVYFQLKDKSKALDYFNQSLLLEREVGNIREEAVTLNNIAQVYADSNQKQKALDYLNQALTLQRKVGDRAREALTLSNLGKIYSDLGESQKALDYYNQSLPLRRAVGARAGEALTLYNMAIEERDRGNLKQALAQIETAVKIIEDLRTKITSQELRTSYFATVQEEYELYIDLLMQRHKQQPSQGYDAKALQVSERARARSLLEILAEAKANIRQGANSGLLQQERSLQLKLDTLEKQRIQLFSSDYTETQAAELERETATLLDQYQQVQTKIRSTSPRYAALTQPQPLTLAEIQQQVLDDDTILLEYSLGVNRSYLWAVTKTGISSYELPKRAEIESAAQAFYDLLNTSTYQGEGRTADSPRGLGITPATARVGVVQKLSQMILGPVAPQLNKKRLLIVSDGTLQYIPFAALPFPTQTSAENPSPPLLVNYEVVNSPSASTLAVLRREQAGRKLAGKTIAVLADPVFSSNDERVKKAEGQRGRGVEGQGSSGQDLSLRTLERSARESDVTFKRLPFTRKEAEAILALVPSAERKQAFDFTADRAVTTSSELSQYRIVHFATHGILNSINPELSGVVLSLVDERGEPQNGFLRLHDVFNLNLPAELVVLSACQTGLGEEVKGEGLIGLTRGFMYAGATRVVVSLWSVDDQATSELMSRFYRGILEKKLQPSAALRGAQMEMWQQQKWKSPYYWAAFVVQGEWR